MIDTANSTERKVLIASTNLKKTAEMLAILRLGMPEVEFVTLSDFPDMQDVEETGNSFMENALLKARYSAAVSGLTTIADDGGLCIDALDGHPGVRSHRFLGEQTSFPDKMDRILDMMRSVPLARRTCRFECAVVIAMQDGRCFECTGICNGLIGSVRYGSYGFGYDPIFYVPELNKYMAELTPDEKSAISHRGRALACVIGILKRELNK